MNINYSRLGVMLFSIASYSISLLFPIIAIRSSNAQLYDSVDPTAINGILTVSAIIFGLSSIKIIEEGMLDVRLIFVFIVGIQASPLFATGISYFSDYLEHGYSTLRTMTLATTSLLTNTYSWPIHMMIKVVYRKD